MSRTNDLERWVGLVVTSDAVIAVDAKVPSDGPIIIQGDHTWPLQKGDRAEAYRVIRQLVADYVREHKIKLAVIKGSAVSMGGTKMAHLEAAELRGVVMCAVAETTKVDVASKAHMSRTFGDRKVDEYLKDSDYWRDAVTGGNLRSGSREAAIMLLGARGK